MIMKTDIVICSKCNGSGKYDGVRIDWLHISARSQNEAIRKARVTAARGCYKDQLDTITATESGIEYTYKTI